MVGCRIGLAAFQRAVRQIVSDAIVHRRPVRIDGHIPAGKLGILCNLIPARLARIPAVKRIVFPRRLRK